MYSIKKKTSTHYIHLKPRPDFTAKTTEGTCFDVDRLKERNRTGPSVAFVQ